MSLNDFDGELFWNEHQWEAHLDEIEKRSEQLRRFITADPKGNTPRWITLLQENMDELDAVDAFIEEELLLDEAYFPDDEDDWEDDDDFDDDDFFFLGEDHTFLGDDDDEDDEDYESGEEWKNLSDDYILSDYGSIENLELYNAARELAVDVLRWAESVPARNHSKAYHDFVGEILKIGAKLAGGYSFGFEQDYLGGNIAYTKKALYCSNGSLNLLQSMKNTSIMQPEDYANFHRRLFEIRNETGVYVQELRDRFQLGLE